MNTSPILKLIVDLCNFIISRPVAKKLYFALSISCIALYFIETCQTGQCQNVNGSYWCRCPAGETGRNCQYKESICQANSCQAGEICLPNLQTMNTKYTCVLASQKFTTRMSVKKEIGWKNYKIYDVETDLNIALQNWKQVVS